MSGIVAWVSDALATCNSCDRAVQTPNAAGYCDTCLAGAEVSTRTGLRIWSACPSEAAARSYAAQWAAGGSTFEVAYRADLSPARPWLVYASRDADAVAGWLP